MKKIRGPCPFWIFVALLLGCCSITTGTTSSKSNTIFGSFAFQSPRHIAKPRKLQLNHPQPRSENPPLFTASLEEGEDLLLFGVTPSKKKTSDDNNNRSSLQRVYETWKWTYVTPSGKNETFNINYRVDAAESYGPPVLLVHGFGANVNHFRHQFTDLIAAGYTVYAIDLLGFGASDKPLTASSIGFSMELFVRQVTDFLEAMSHRHPNQSWSIAGNSIGGLCCLGVAAQWEEQQRLKQSQPQPVDTEITNFDIASVILFNSAGGMTAFRYEYVPFWARPIMAFVQFVLLGPVLGGFFFENFRSPENIEQILKQSGVYTNTSHVDDELLELLLTPADDTGAQQVFLAVFGGPPGPSPESYLQQIKTTPILAMWGETDPWTPLNAGLHPGTGFAQFCDTLRLEVLPQTGHCPHDEAPHLVNPRLIAFLNKLYASLSSQQSSSRSSPSS